MKVAAVIVTCNRLGLLKQNLAAVRAQTRGPDEIIVINNGSTDGTAEWLKGESGLTVIIQANSGSSGGQLTGIKTAWEHGHDWIWCMDDDTIPSPTALERMLTSPLANRDNTGFLCSVVRWKDGSIHLMNPPDLDRNYVKMMELLPLGALKARTASFVSILIHRRAVAAKGLPLREMFLWFDDAEYSLRITRSFDCYQILNSAVEHRTEVNSFVDFENMGATPKGKLRYGLRNFIFLRKWQAPSTAVGLVRAVKSALRMQMRICRQFPMKDYWALSTAAWSGIFFAPKIEFPEKTQVSSGN